MSDDEKNSIEAAVSELKEAIKSNEKAQIEDKLTALTNATSKMTERVYAKKSAEQQATGEAAAPDDAAKESDAGVVDAEFEEVNEDK